MKTAQLNHVHLQISETCSGHFDTGPKNKALLSTLKKRFPPFQFGLSVFSLVLFYSEPSKINTILVHYLSYSWLLESPGGPQETWWGGWWGVLDDLVVFGGVLG